MTALLLLPAELVWTGVLIDRVELEMVSVEPNRNQAKARASITAFPDRVDSKRDEIDENLLMQEAEPLGPLFYCGE